MSQNERSNNNGWGAPIIIVVALILLVMMVASVLQVTHVIHTWHTENFDGVEVKVCIKCGELEEVTQPKCNHNWSVRQEESGEFIAFCTKCDETKVAD